MKMGAPMRAAAAVVIILSLTLLCHAAAPPAAERVPSPNGRFYAERQPDGNEWKVFPADERSGRTTWTFKATLRDYHPYGSPPQRDATIYLSNDGNTAAIVPREHVTRQDLRDGRAVEFWNKHGLLRKYPLTQLCPDAPVSNHAALDNEQCIYNQHLWQTEVRRKDDRLWIKTTTAGELEFELDTSHTAELPTKRQLISLKPEDWGRKGLKEGIVDMTGCEYFLINGKMEDVACYSGGKAIRPPREIPTLDGKRVLVIDEFLCAGTTYATTDRTKPLWKGRFNSDRVVGKKIVMTVKDGQDLEFDLLTGDVANVVTRPVVDESKQVGGAVYSPNRRFFVECSKDNTCWNVFAAENPKSPLWVLASPMLEFQPQRAERAIPDVTAHLSDDGQMVMLVPRGQIRLRDLRERRGVEFWNKTGLVRAYPIAEVCPMPPPSISLNPPRDFQVAYGWRLWQTGVERKGSRLSVRTTTADNLEFDVTEARLVNAPRASPEYPSTFFLPRNTNRAEAQTGANESSPSHTRPPCELFSKDGKRVLMIDDTLRGYAIYNAADRAQPIATFVQKQPGWRDFVSTDVNSILFIRQPVEPNNAWLDADGVTLWRAGHEMKRWSLLRLNPDPPPDKELAEGEKITSKRPMRWWSEVIQQGDKVILKTTRDRVFVFDLITGEMTDSLDPNAKRSDTASTVRP